MNFRTVRTIRQGRKHGESGQAFTELAISLLAFLVVFIGFLLIASLGSDRVYSLIKAREQADKESSSGLSSQGGESIRYWDYGKDEIPFTVDDRAVSGSYGDGAYFRGQLADNTREVTLQHPPSSTHLQSDFSSLQDSNLFVNAASLAKGSASPRYSIHDSGHYLNVLEPAIEWLFHMKNTDIEETVYMPAHKSLENRGD